MGTARARALAVGPVVSYPGATAPLVIEHRVWAWPLTFVLGFASGVVIVFYWIFQL